MPAKKKTVEEKKKPAPTAVVAPSERPPVLVSVGIPVRRPQK